MKMKKLTSFLLQNKLTLKRVKKEIFVVSYSIVVVKYVNCEVK